MTNNDSTGASVATEDAHKANIADESVELADIQDFPKSASEDATGTEADTKALSSSKIRNRTRKLADTPPLKEHRPEQPEAEGHETEPEDITNARLDYLKLQKESKALETVEKKVIEAEKKLETANINRLNKLSLHYGKLAVVNNTVGASQRRQAQFLDGVTITFGGKSIPLQVTSRTSFEATLIRGTHRWLDGQNTDISKQTVSQHANALKLMQIELPEGTAEEIADHIKGPHLQKNGKTQNGLIGACERYRWLKTIVDLEERKALALTTTGGEDKRVSDAGASHDSDQETTSQVDQEDGQDTAQGDNSDLGITPEEELEGYIGMVSASTDPLEGVLSSEITSIKRQALVPVVVEGGNIVIGWDFARELRSEFIAFMKDAELEASV